MPGDARTPQSSTAPIASPAPPRARDSVASRALPIYVALVGALLTWIGLMMLSRLIHVLLLIFISALFAAAMSGPVDFFERMRIPRLVSASLIQLVVLAGIVLAGWLLLPPLFDQGARLADTVPDRLQQYQGLQEAYDKLRGDYPQLESLDSQLASIGERFVSAVGERLVDLPQQLARVMLDLLAISVISALLVANRARFQGFALSLVHPRHRERAHAVAEQMWQRLGRYVRAKVIVMAIVGSITFAALFALDIRFPLLLAAIVALGEAIPQVGPWIARVPLFGVAALEGWKTLVLVVILSLIVENLKGYLISPAIEGDQLDIDPLVVIVSVLCGGALLGPIGAFVAVPAAACVQVIFEEVVIPWRRAQIGEPEAAPAD